MKGAVSVVIGTYGDEELWGQIAQRAADSAQAQTCSVEVITSHGDSLQTARNYGASEATGEYLVFLDADDELDSYYVEKMLEGKGDIRQPSTLGVVDGKPDDFPVLIPRKPLLEANYLVIGSMVRRNLFLDSGGFDAYPILEDWALWLKLVVCHGAVVDSCSEAIYKVHVNPDGRNNRDASLHGSTYSEIRQRFMPEVQARGLPWHLDGFRS